MRGSDICHISEEQLNVMRQKISLSFQFAALLDSLTSAITSRFRCASTRSFRARRFGRPVWTRSKASDSPMPTTISPASFRAACSSAPALRARSSRGPSWSSTTSRRPASIRSSRKLITDTILKLRAKLNGTAVVISHDLPSIFAMADYVAMLFEGAIIAYDTADRIRNSPNPIVQQFLQGSEVGPIPI